MTENDPILLLPGMLCDAELWRDQVEMLQGQGTFIVPVLDAATIELMADDVLRKAPSRFALAGLSMGGYVALAIARKAPRRVSRLFLANTSARADSAAQTAGRHAAIAQVEAGHFERVVERLLAVLVDPSRREDTALMTRIAAMLVRIGPEAFVRQQLAAAGRPDGRAGLGRIEVPTLVLAGDNDRVIPPDHSVEIANGISGANLTVLKDCGHLSPLERPEQVTDALRRWMAG